jgi:hypothetical protein
MGKAHRQKMKDLNKYYADRICQAELVEATLGANTKTAY